MNLKKALQEKLSKSELAVLRKSFDSLGNIAILEIPKELEKKEKQIATALMQLHPRFETVVKKTSSHKGKYRVERVKVIAGKRNLIANYKEWNCKFRIHLGKVYFSPRLSTERERIAKQAKNGEKACVFFAGVGPFAIIIAKHANPEIVVGIEWNKTAFKDFCFNIEKNKVKGKVVGMLGDVKKIVGRNFKNCFDRIVMPSPENAKQYLEVAFKAIKNNKTIHYYAFARKEANFSEVVNEVRQEAKKAKVRVKVLSKKIVRPYSKEVAQVVLDLKVLKGKKRK